MCKSSDRKLMLNAAAAKTRNIPPKIIMCIELRQKAEASLQQLNTGRNIQKS